MFNQYAQHPAKRFSGSPEQLIPYRKGGQIFWTDI
jgi:hypothetical protein